MAGLTRAEKHGKRLDWIGRQRKIRDADPLVVGGMDLVDLYAAHVDGARQNKGAKKPVLHYIVRFPPEVLLDDGPTPFARLDRAGRERLMVEQAVRFINESHGGQAVFAARLDRDEAGESIVDVFACPRYMKPSRSERREPALWTSATKFGEELARKHQDHIRARMKDATTTKAITSPRAVGMALQEEFGEFFARENGVNLDARKFKESPAQDRLAIEEWRLRQMEADAAEARQALDEARAACAEAEGEARKAQEARADAEDKARKAQAAQAEAEAREKAAQEHAAEIAQAGRVLVDEMREERIHYAKGREDQIRFKNKEASVAILPGLPELEPLVFAAAAIQKERDEKRAFIARQIENLTMAFKAIRSAIPVVRRMLQSPATPPKERAEAKVARREIVRVGPIARNALNRAREDAQKIGVSLPAEDPGSTLSL
ncbi:hypothetical protein B0A89_00960 [Paracoccus contaminans]|uniref:Uncharacterized protein n=2 Tax=Paracoccus contaminans TaxID=1945662 RepID=A0A1W6CU86_9RHOB|nr:hypothetical protein B0A89_00960 [Paracoccus contaminans]